MTPVTPEKLSPKLNNVFYKLITYLFLESIIKKYSYLINIKLIIKI